MLYIATTHALIYKSNLVPVARDDVIIRAHSNKGLASASAVSLLCIVTGLEIIGMQLY